MNCHATNKGMAFFGTSKGQRLSNTQWVFAAHLFALPKCIEVDESHKNRKL
jgi:hypothetical protein